MPCTVKCDTAPCEAGGAANAVRLAMSTFAASATVGTTWRRRPPSLSVFPAPVHSVSNTPVSDGSLAAYVFKSFTVLFETPTDLADDGDDFRTETWGLRMLRFAIRDGSPWVDGSTSA